MTNHFLDNFYHEPQKTYTSDIALVISLIIFATIFWANFIYQVSLIFK